ncbi:MAG: hypothetical protein RLZZ455_239 [Candidatus Parcubacteria bacterium]|jgi:hypothetical protein
MVEQKAGLTTYSLPDMQRPGELGIFNKTNLIVISGLNGTGVTELGSTLGKSPGVLVFSDRELITVSSTRYQGNLPEISPRNVAYHAELDAISARLLHALGEKKGVLVRPTGGIIVSKIREEAARTHRPIPRITTVLLTQSEENRYAGAIQARMNQLKEVPDQERLQHVRTLERKLLAGVRKMYDLPEIQDPFSETFSLMGVPVYDVTLHSDGLNGQQIAEKLSEVASAI